MTRPRATNRGNEADFDTTPGGTVLGGYPFRPISSLPDRDGPLGAVSCPNPSSAAFDSPLGDAFKGNAPPPSCRAPGVFLAGTRDYRTLK